MLPTRKQAYREKLHLGIDYSAQLVRFFNKLKRKSRLVYKYLHFRPAFLAASDDFPGKVQA